MPRMLTLWLDYGARVTEFSKSHKNGAPSDQTKLQEINKLIQSYTQKLPSYEFLATFSQLVSRICHENESVRQCLNKIIIKTMNEYPQQALWQMVAVSNSDKQERSEKCDYILKKLEKKSLAGIFKNLVKYLLAICHKEVANGQNLSIECNFQGLGKLAPMDVILPLQTSLTVTLPMPSQPVESHDKSFPENLPKIHGFRDEIEVLASLQKPRKITIMGNDSKDYLFLLKPRDDLRKDCRMMELNSVLNKLFKKDPEGRMRRLRFFSSFLFLFFSFFLLFISLFFI